ncbi:hypothetical protein KI387_004706, partial [Taxus chinensis]
SGDCGWNQCKSYQGSSYQVRILFAKEAANCRKSEKICPGQSGSKRPKLSELRKKREKSSRAVRGTE